MKFGLWKVCDSLESRIIDLRPFGNNDFSYINFTNFTFIKLIIKGSNLMIFIRYSQITNYKSLYAILKFYNNISF